MLPLSCYHGLPRPGQLSDMNAPNSQEGLCAIQNHLRAKESGLLHFWVALIQVKCTAMSGIMLCTHHIQAMQKFPSTLVCWTL